MKALSYQQYKQVLKMSHNDLNRFIVSMYRNGYEQAKQDIVGDEDGVAVVLDEAEVIEVLRQCRISEKRAVEIVGRLTERNGE